MLWTLLLLVTSSCGTITVYDREVCGDLGIAGAHCRHTLVDKSRDLTRAQWDHERVGMLCMSPTAYNDAETAIDQFCAAYNVCDYQTRESLQESFARIAEVARRAKKARKAAFVEDFE